MLYCLHNTELPLTTLFLETTNDSEVGFIFPPFKKSGGKKSTSTTTTCQVLTELQCVLRHMNSVVPIDTNSVVPIDMNSVVPIDMNSVVPNDVA